MKASVFEGPSCALLSVSHSSILPSQLINISTPRGPSMHRCMLPTQSDFLANWDCAGARAFTNTVQLHITKAHLTHTHTLETDAARESSAGLRTSNCGEALIFHIHVTSSRADHTQAARFLCLSTWIHLQAAVIKGVVKLLLTTE